MLTVDEALRQIRTQVTPLAPRLMPAVTAVECFLAETIAADVDSPPHDKSVVDGYAIRFGDLDQGRAELRLLEEVTAGAVPRLSVASGTTTRIMTGAPLPPGADAVVMVERSAQPSPDVVRLDDPKAKLGQNIVRRGTAIRTGDVVLKPGRKITPAAVGLLAEVGRAEVRVVPRPRVAILATGNELVAAGEKPGPGQIRNSNGPMLAALVAQAGAEAVPLGVARDDREHLRSLIARGLECDLLVLSGGVSAGVLDLVPNVLAELGVAQLFHKVSMKPGKPVWFGLRDSGEDAAKPVFGLPGNPVSTLVCFELFVRPAIAQLAGRVWPEENRRRARLREPFLHRGDRPTYWPGLGNSSADGSARSEVTPLRWQGSGDLRTLVDADCLICFSAGDREYSAGEEVDVRPFG